MSNDLIQGVDEESHATILALNNDHAQELSLLSADELAAMIAGAFHAVRVGTGDAFLLAFDQDAAYTSPNFLWFKARYPRFIYVDRIVVSPKARGRGLARLLYEDLFSRARAAGHDRICCEVNAEPPNPASDAFHAALDFQEVGEAAIHGGEKTVRYYLRAL
ncbi:GNAT family N-acetyltransferase [Tianweitania sp. BSSL-BM11]|uniref:GNAT family N-acetyltransferase n=1 Tax=Tianweitania aestuarii TaxID=2814886 RepID=A0ABS5RVK4_9HYPH|nr:GNAT family N-acetyltransferase [Tianweitania aestuarii]MBS9721088.1 GNAT family N-acetyltransferase [Tianweitania aestuarii]